MANEKLLHYDVRLEHEAVTLAFRRLKGYRLQGVYWVRNDRLGVILCVEFYDENEHLRFFLAKGLNAMMRKLHTMALID